MSELKIGEGQKYDTTKVSEDGVKREESTKSKRKLNLIFNQFDINKDGTLNSEELARMVSVFNAADSNNSKSLSKTEFNDLAEALNEILPWGEKVSGKDVKNFFKRIMHAQKNDEKVSVEEIVTQQPNTASEEEVTPAASEPEVAAPVTPDENPESAAPRPAIPETETETEDEAPVSLNNYTVQNGESYNDLIIRSLKAQGIENPTEEQIKHAKENFEKNNPGAVHTNKKGVQYLLVGEKVKLEGKLEDKNNSQEAINEYVQQQQSAAASSRRRSKGIDNSVLEKAKAQGLRTTYSDKYFYSEKTKKHYYYNKKKGQFLEDPNIVFVAKDGSYRKEIRNQDGSTRSITYDKEGYATKMQALNYKKHFYTNRDFAAKKLGLRETLATKSKGIFYDPKSKIHFTWNPKTHTFEAMDKSVRMVGKDGWTYDKNGQNGNVQLRTDGTDVETDPETGKVTTRTYRDNGSRSYQISKYPNGEISEYWYDENDKLTHQIDKYPEGLTSEFWFDENDRTIKRVNTDKDGNVKIYSFTYGKGGSCILQQLDEHGNNIGEPKYYDSNHNALTKEQYEALQK